MSVELTNSLGSVCTHFLPQGQLKHSEPFGSGHINQTYLVTIDGQRYILQCLNTNIFPNPHALMDNMVRVCDHLCSKGHSAPEVLRTPDGQPFALCNQGGFWRLSPFFEGTRTVDQPQSPRQAFQVGKAFGGFARAVADLPGPRLHETLPDFHHTPKRIERLFAAVDGNPHGRVAGAGPEIDFVGERRDQAARLLAAGLPERITHNDTKINNVLLDSITDEAVCVIDLDTVMPGLALFDFGDMVRTTTCLAAEDETNLSLLSVDHALFSALTEGYLQQVHDVLTPTELELLAFSGWVITLEIGVRFLTDHLEGDTYFKIHRPDHNLERARAQFALARSLEQQMTRLEDTVERLRESVARR
ncbi:MAG: aminoglycoside phosphotransferase family protein [Candidatus Eremiobacteraeota bacterium]|nr:aminoglycoside phosphotransferase family protein [Candidatus Eremiobacteraeota bacterium]